ncbi:hypothetical protein MUP01_05620 [Candidatus Bathyarchaeota archaeon]|nr:hypothetical protein [Candidatus Bathyarchaeota archaeon]
MDENDFDEKKRMNVSFDYDTDGFEVPHSLEKEKWGFAGDIATFYV